MSSYRNLTICNFCYEEIRTEEISEHYEICNEVPELCPNNCGAEGFKRSEMNYHLDNLCPYRTVYCMFVTCGCPFKGTESEINDHMYKNLLMHMQYMCAKMYTQECEIKALKEDADFKNEMHSDTLIGIKQLNVWCSGLDTEVTELSEHFLFMEKFVNEQKHSIEYQNNVIDALLKKITSFENELEEKTYELKTFQNLFLHEKYLFEKHMRKLEKQNGQYRLDFKSENLLKKSLMITRKQKSIEKNVTYLQQSFSRQCKINKAVSQDVKIFKKTLFSNLDKIHSQQSFIDDLDTKHESLKLNTFELLAGIKNMLNLQKKIFERHINGANKSNLKLENISTQQSKQETNLTDLQKSAIESKDESKNVNKKIVDLKTKVTALEQISLFFDEKVAEQAEQHVNLTTKLMAVSRKIKHFEGALKPGTLLWKIDNFNKKKTKNEVVYTQMLTSKYGYKLELCLYPNGNDEFVGSHMSIYYTLGSGPNDEILKWPFTSCITAALLEQNSNNPKDFECDLSGNNAAAPSGVFSRPPRNNMNSFSWGLPDFISHEKLYTGKYIHDDKIFILINVVE